MSKSSEQLSTLLLRVVNEGVILRDRVVSKSGKTGKLMLPSYLIGQSVCAIVIPEKKEIVAVREMIDKLYRKDNQIKHALSKAKAKEAEIIEKYANEPKEEPKTVYEELNLRPIVLDDIPINSNESKQKKIDIGDVY